MEKQKYKIILNEETCDRDFEKIRDISLDVISECEYEDLIDNWYEYYNSDKRQYIIETYLPEKLYYQLLRMFNIETIEK